MGLSTLEQTTINKGLAAAKLVIEQLKPILDQMNIIYDSDGGAKATITQQNLDTVPGYSGLTKAELDDGMFALTATLRNDITNAYLQLVKLAARG